MKRIILLLAIISITNSFAQEKQLWAKSFLNKQAPELVVEKWLTDEPETEGKFILIDFWATWCAPCRKGIPELNDFHHKFSDKLVVIGISDEPKKKIKRMKNPRIEYYSAIDQEKRLKNTYQVKGIPHCVIINPDGIVVWEGYPLLEEFELTESVVAGLLEN